MSSLKCCAEDDKCAKDDKHEGTKEENKLELTLDNSSTAFLDEEKSANIVGTVKALNINQVSEPTLITDLKSDTKDNPKEEQGVDSSQCKDPKKGTGNMIEVKEFHFNPPSGDALFAPMFTFKLPENINTCTFSDVQRVRKFSDENITSKVKKPSFKFGNDASDKDLVFDTYISPGASSNEPAYSHIKNKLSVDGGEPHLTTGLPGKDLRVSVLVQQGVMEVHLPYEQKEYTNIIFKRDYDNAMISADVNSKSKPLLAKSITTPCGKRETAKTQDTYKSHILPLLNSALTSIVLTKEVPPATIPISFKTLNYFTDWLWDCMVMGVPPQFELFNTMNKAIFQKGALLLAEAKLSYAQRSLPQQPKKGLSSRDVFTNERLSNLKSMSARVPLPLAAYLECIGNTSMLGQVVTPVLVEHPDHTALSGAPSHMIKLFRTLRMNGVPLNGPIHHQVLELGLPMLNFVEYANSTYTGRSYTDSKVVKITEESFNFWASHREKSVLKWDEDDCNTFKKIISSLESKKGFNVDLDISHGIGSQAQFVETTDYKVDRPTRWFTSFPVDDNSIKLGATFSFLCNENSNKESAIHMKGEITPRQIMFAIFSSVFQTQNVV